MATRKRYSPEQVVRKLMAAHRLLTEVKAGQHRVITHESEVPVDDGFVRPAGFRGTRPRLSGPRDFLIFGEQEPACRQT